MISSLFRNVYYFKEYRILNSLKTHQNYSDSEILAYQILKLKTVLNEAKKIPYYRKYIEDLDLGNLTYKEFGSIPFLNKSIIRNELPYLLNKDAEKVHKIYDNTSGGSTGEPVSFKQTKEQKVFGMGNYFYGNFLNGINPNDRMISFWGAVRDMHHPLNHFYYYKVKNYLLNSEKLNTFILNEEKVISYINKINVVKPKAIRAYVHSLYEIAKYINLNNIKIKCRPIIHTSTGPLYPQIRQEIKRAFNNAHVFSFYGSREVSAIATETPFEKGMTVFYDNVFLEIINKEGLPAKRGEEGEIVVTTLNNHYMPLIRYKIGDRAIKYDDELTFGTLRIQSVLGRTLGVIHTKDGNKIDGQFFTTLFFEVIGINNFQLIQKSINKLQLNLIKNDKFNQDELDGILKRIRSEVGEVEIDVSFRTKINLTETGKIMYVYSELE